MDSYLYLTTFVEVYLQQLTCSWKIFDCQPRKSVETSGVGLQWSHLISKPYVPTGPLSTHGLTLTVSSFCDSIVTSALPPSHTPPTNHSARPICMNTMINCCSRSWNTSIRSRMFFLRNIGFNLFDRRNCRAVNIRCLPICIDGSDPSQRTDCRDCLVPNVSCRHRRQTSWCRSCRFLRSYINCNTTISCASATE